ncbi:hypothetical protein H0H81_003055, partial [Sphagnurus paluster]
MPLEESGSEDDEIVDDPNDPDFEDVQFAGMSSTTDPCTHKQAMKVPDSEKWKAAANDEIMSL